MPQIASITRPRFFAIAISALTGNVYRIPDIEQMTTQKRDDGSAGSFSFTTPLIQPYSQSGQAAYPRILPYAAVAGPMDLIALYAWRTSTIASNASNSTADSNPFADTNDFANLKYGEAPTSTDSNGISVGGATTVKTLGTSACVMIGMVDGAHTTQGITGSRASFTVTGTDLTKPLEQNDVSVPDTSLAVGAGGPSGGQSAFFGLTSIQLTRGSLNKGAAALLTTVLDLLVGKDLNALKTLNGAKTVLPGQPIIDAYKNYAYPWRNFIRTDALDTTYQPLSNNKYPPYQPQMGAAWSSCLELRNPPISLMFVNEIGQLIYMDSFAAWTSNQVYGIVGPEDVREFDSGFSDENLITFVSVMPTVLTGANANISFSKGFFIGSGFVNGVAQASSSSQAHVAIYGYRVGQFTSIYDITVPDAAKRTKYVLQQHNNIFTANAVVRGNSIFRVGQRYQFMVDTGRPETTNAKWYVEAVSHNMTYGDDWTTTLSLRFPQNSNFGVDYYPS
jgi:hypothetical protein